MVTLAKVKPKQPQKTQEEIIEEVINNTPEKRQSLKELEEDKSKKSKGWQNWCLRIKKQTLAEIDEIISREEWVGYKKTTWILQAVNEKLKAEKDKYEKQSNDE